MVDILITDIPDRVIAYHEEQARLQNKSLDDYLTEFVVRNAKLTRQELLMLELEAARLDEVPSPKSP